MASSAPLSIPKPPGLSLDYARQFQDASIVEAYQHRPPSPDEVFEILHELIGDRPPCVLDIGCGRGEVARPLARLVERVDAVDFSPAMIETGKQLAGGDNPRLHWICGAVEDVPLTPPYGLVTAGSSLHWMNWDVVLPKLAGVLADGGLLATFDDAIQSPPWANDLGALIARYSTNREFQRYTLLEELEKRGLYRPLGTRQTQPVRFIQAVDAYIESFHSRNGFSRERMSAQAANEFDDAARAVVAPYSSDDHVELTLICTVAFGGPLNPLGGQS